MPTLYNSHDGVKVKGEIESRTLGNVGSGCTHTHAAWQGTIPPTPYRVNKMDLHFLNRGSDAYCTSSFTAIDER